MPSIRTHETIIVVMPWYEGYGISYYWRS